MAMELYRGCVLLPLGLLTYTSNPPDRAFTYRYFSRHSKPLDHVSETLDGRFLAK